MTNPATGTTARVASVFSRLNPVPSFPEYTGPYKVGTVDVEVPISGLVAPSPTPDGAADIHTVQFRIFYPATPDSQGKRTTWLPAPQRLHVSAYTQFLGVGSKAASVLSFIPRHLHYTTIPVHKNAGLLPPPPSSDSEEPARWPTAIFSHGLGGSRNAYSHVAASLAAHGVVVICTEHRDGSAAVSLIRDPSRQNRFLIKNTRRVVSYVRIPHDPTAAIWAKRDAQMRIRLWELGLIFEAVLAIDSSQKPLIRSNMNGSTPEAALAQFGGALDVREPGKVIFSGHSFGAATMVQLLKSTYYARSPALADAKSPLFVPSTTSAIAHQITERNPTFLLDMWCFPLLSAATAPLFKLPLPAYADVPSAPGGTAVLAIESETFFKWKEHLHTKARVLSPTPAEKVVTPAAFDRPLTGRKMEEPSFFYVANSAHLNQSDFGVLFPWLTRKVFGADQPERALRLNLRAQLQFLRANGVRVARTWAGDLVDGAAPVPGGKDKLELGSLSESETESVATTAMSSADSLGKNRGGGMVKDKGLEDGVHNDQGILARTEETGIDAWKWIDMIGLGGESAPSQLELESGLVSEGERRRQEEGEREMEMEIEPSLPAVAEAETAAVKAAAAAAVGGSGSERDSDDDGSGAGAVAVQNVTTASATTA
ncbi:platelet-activating factor acetylhydrolase, isoform II-domain-containing protein [Bombardia bombarda]|uniref:Putative phospholipase n=1 Tax=Bombardia bombarda TaxID=252184 RepID=A0AA39WIE6_9PEZI|nr:platelet-activating factor acetylhydrolase, isoform II-domain-containing protein [Bombardia bombarda]